MLEAGLAAEVLQLARQHDAHATAQRALDVVRVKEGGLNAAFHVEGKHHGLGRVADAYLLNDAGDGDVVPLLRAGQADVLVVADVVPRIVAQ